MKKITAALLSFLFITQLCTAPVYAETPYETIKRNIHVFGGSATADVIIINDITLISLDSLTFYMSASPGAKNGNPAIRKGDHTVSIQPGTDIAFVDDVQVTMPVSSIMVANRLYVPLSFVVQSLGHLVYWRGSNETIYIQNPDYYEKALDIVTKSMAAISEKSHVATAYINHTNLSDSGPYRYFIKSTGMMKTNMADNISMDESTSTLYNGYYDSVRNEPVQIYVDTNPIDSWYQQDYITANGIYTLNEAGAYLKEPVPPENISTMDMATKSVFTDPELFLYSATISQNYDGAVSIKAETDIGVLIKVGFDIYLPEEANSLDWTQTYQTITYDSQTYLPKTMDLYLNASFHYNYPNTEEIVRLTYDHQYSFDFTETFVLELPDSIE